MVEPIKRYGCFRGAVKPKMKTLFFMLIGTTKKQSKSGSTQIYIYNVKMKNMYLESFRNEYAAKTNVYNCS